MERPPAKARWLFFWFAVSAWGGGEGPGIPARLRRSGEEGTAMARIDAQLVAQRLREVVADEPKAFAYEIGVSLSALYNYLNGRIPSTEVLFRIACYTGRPMEWFLGP